MYLYKSVYSISNDPNVFTTQDGNHICISEPHKRLYAIFYDGDIIKLLETRYDRLSGFFKMKFFLDTESLRKKLFFCKEIMYRQNIFDLLKDNIVCNSNLVCIKNILENTEKLDPIPIVNYKQNEFKLKEHQIQNAMWMNSIEQNIDKNFMMENKDFIVEQNIIFDLKNKKFIPDSTTNCVQELEIYKELKMKGGCLSDESGLGKSVSIIQGCLLNTYKKDSFIANNKIHVKTTLIICNQQNCHNWIEDIRKLDSTKKFVSFVTLEQWERCCYEDIKNADFLILSMDFLSNLWKNKNILCYNADFKTAIDIMAEEQLNSPYFNEKCCPHPSLFHFHRIIYDNFQNIIFSDMNKKLFESFDSTYSWICSSASKFCSNEIMGLISNFDIDVVDEKTEKFLKKFFTKTRISDINLTENLYKTIVIKSTQKEFYDLTNSCENLGLVFLQNISNTFVNFDTQNEMYVHFNRYLESVEKVTNVENNKYKKMICENLDNEKKCPVCFEIIIEKIVLFSCGHAFCETCVKNLIGVCEKSKNCPACRAYIYPYRPIFSCGVTTQRLSSKAKYVLNYIKNVDPTDKILLFTNYMNDYCLLLTENKISNTQLDFYKRDFYFSNSSDKVLVFDKTKLLEGSDFSIANHIIFAEPLFKDYKLPDNDFYYKKVISAVRNIAQKKKTFITFLKYENSIEQDMYISK